MYTYTPPTTSVKLRSPTQIMWAPSMTYRYHCFFPRSEWIRIPLQNSNGQLPFEPSIQIASNLKLSCSPQQHQQNEINHGYVDYINMACHLMQQPYKRRRYLLKSRSDYSSTECKCTYLMVSQKRIEVELIIPSPSFFFCSSLIYTISRFCINELVVPVFFPSAQQKQNQVFFRATTS